MPHEQIEDIYHDKGEAVWKERCEEFDSHLQPESVTGYQTRVMCGCAGELTANLALTERVLYAERERDELKAELTQIFGMACDAPELNMSNYDVDQVSALNNAMIDIWRTANDALEAK